MGVKTKIFIIISIVVFILDLIFIAINYSSSKAALYSTLIESAKENQNDFNLTVLMSQRNMLQISRHYTQRDDLNQLFLMGKKAVESEGGGAGKERAYKARMALLDKVKSGWDEMMQEFRVRQLHYHLGPGSVSFLRVHKPNKYGDRLDDVRYTIVDTNAEKKSRVGFETGRVYSGLRGVSPVWAIDPETKEKVHVGAVEVGASFDQILPVISEYYNTNIAVLLTRSHIKKNMWYEFFQQYVKDRTDRDYFVESSSSPEVDTILNQLEVSEDFVANDVSLINYNNRYISSYYFPFRDYRATKNPQLPPVGFVLVWKDVSTLVQEFHNNIMINVIYAFIGLIIIELTLFFLFKHELNMSRLAMHDSLTGLPNRAYFKEYVEHELARAQRTNKKLALLYIDLDGFKVINDEFGHKVGDSVLTKVASEFQKFRRTNEVLARLGGDEFCMVLYGFKDVSELEHAAERMIKQCSHVIKVGGVERKIGMSIGIAAYPDDGQSYEELISKADALMYKAKRDENRSYSLPE